MTNWNMRTEELELKDGGTIKNYHYEFNSTDRVLAKIVEDVFKGIMDIKADRKTEPSNSEKPNNSTKATISKMEQVPSCIDCTHYGDYEVCKGCDDDYNKFKSYYEPKDEPQTERSE